MLPEEIGIVRLEDLETKKVYVCLEKELFESLNKEIREIGITKLARKLNVSDRIINHWLSDGSRIRLDALLKICTYFDLDFEKNIVYLSGTVGMKINNPKLPFDFTTNEGIRVLAGILGDGGVAADKPNPYYSNSDTNLIDGFVRDITTTLGQVEHHIQHMTRKNTTVQILTFPPIVFNVISKLGIKQGKKVETNPKIPKFIFTLEPCKKYSFVSQFIDDEGTINKAAMHISITSSCLLKYTRSNLLHGINELLESFDILSSMYQSKVYLFSRGEPRRTWKLQIAGQLQLQKLQKHLNLRVRKKDQDLIHLLSLFKLTIFRRRDVDSTYFNYMKGIEDSQGYFTSFDLARVTGRVVGSCRNTILKYRKLNLIKCVKPCTSGDDPQPGRYTLNIKWN